MIGMWVRGLLRRRAGRLAAAAAGIAVAVALLACLGAFLAHSKATMTDRAVRGVDVDWQVQVQPAADPAAVAADVRAAPGVLAGSTVGFAQTAGLTATTGGTTQSTGPGVVLGIPDDYRSVFPSQLRTLSGADSGVLLAQQTAANLHAAPGDTVMIGRAGLPAAPVTVAGIVDLPRADTLFQHVGAPPAAQPSAPPDNVVLIPATLWGQLFDPLAATRPDLVDTQIHVELDHQLPTDPASAYTAVTAAAHHLEAVTAGGAVVGDNLAAALDAARSDAAYAELLFGFLGLPAAVLAALLTGAVTAAGAGRRRREQALLRVRGATSGQLLRLAAAEAAVTGAAGALLGLAGAVVIGWAAFGTAGFGTTTGEAVIWAAAAAAAGMLIAVSTILLPASRDLRRSTVAAARAAVDPVRYPGWARYGLDFALLTAAGLLFAAAARSGYQLVLAPEGVPSISVSYWTLAAPALLWTGAGLLTWRLTDLLLHRGRPLLRTFLRPLTSPITTLVVAGMSRSRRPLTRAVVLLALAVSFAASTATFNATYAQQAEADAQLSNGADVTVTEPPTATVSPDAAAALTVVPGVRAVEPLLHRFGYIGTDLQDLYGVNPATITSVTALQDSYVTGGTATELMSTLAARPDSILVSAETVTDYQLTPGDTVTLRLVDARTHQPVTVPFRYAGVVNEFPTAPKDSFFVANAAYLAQRTGSDAVGAFLIDTGGKDSPAVAERVDALLAGSATVTDITTTRQVVGSSLTAVDLTGLTRIELGFAVLLAAAAGGLVLGLGVAERRRSFAIATALGARPRHLRAIIGSDAAVLAVTGLAAGAAIGWGLSRMLVTVLTGVFDPPPAALAVPWPYLAVLAAATVLALAGVTAGAVRASSTPAMRVLREP